MTEISMTKCDGPGCEKRTDHNSYGSPTYHRLIVGGSDFEMSFGSMEDRTFDFCSLECLLNLVNEAIEK